VEAGDSLYQAMLSCLRVKRLSLTGALPPTAASCDGVVGEACCQVAPETEAYVSVWSLIQASDTDALVTSDANEFNTLIREGWGSQVCVPLWLSLCIIIIIIGCSRFALCSPCAFRPHRWHEAKTTGTRDMPL
jgi:hypothetical protein